MPNLLSTLQEALAQATRECSLLIGHEITLKEVVSRTVSSDEYLGTLDNAVFVIGVESKEEYQGIFYLLVTLRDAIALSGMLLGVPAARIQEKRKLAIVEDDDTDAFSEIANQIIGSFNTVFAQNLPKKSHLKQQTPLKFIPGSDQATIVSGDYFLVQAPLGMVGQELEPVTLLMPLTLVSLLEPVEATEPDDPAEPLMEETAAQADHDADSVAEPAQQKSPAAGKPLTVLLFESNGEDRQQLQEVLVASGLTPLVATLDGDMKKLLSQEEIQAVLLGITGSDEQQLSFCRKIKAHFRDIQIPIIICARQWTRTAVLTALKYGAREILLKPCLAEELSVKVLKLVNEQRPRTGTLT